MEYLLARIKRFTHTRPALITIAFMVTGVVALAVSRAASQSTGIEAESSVGRNGVSIISSSSASAGSAIKFDGVRRFFADDASWNKTISQMGGEFTELKPFAYRLWDYGGGTNTSRPNTTYSPAPPGTFFLDFKDYSVPIYDVHSATTTARVFQVVWSQNQQQFSQSGRIKIGDSIPWNPNWKPGTGFDRIMQIVNYETGVVYGLWGVGEAPAGCFDFLGPNGQAGYDASNPNHLCLAGVDTYDNLWTAKEGTTTSERGMGINKLALVTRADEVASGNIGHALELTTSNPMFGAGSETPGVVSPNGNMNGSDPLGLGMVFPKYDPLQLGAGTAKGFYMKPATRLEHEFGYIGRTLFQGNSPQLIYNDLERSKTNPSGMRFGLNLGPDLASSESAITAWLNQKNYTGVKRTTAATFARAWRDYGAIIGETGGWGIGIETDGIIGGSVNPAVAKWAALGITDDGTPTQSINTIDFSGLITRDRLYVVKPPQ